ncbi:hypothetical protein BHE74_00000367 [Ensete ventricosum]|nr:hypothetical protein BHE74_00000367 [Ensete ventricosum]RZR90912.1 hypothetical protein BHM03_00018918 [Ensete ventricosum]
MAESPSSIESIRNWIVEHKLRTVGNFLNLGLHAQALTLAALAGAAVVEYYDHQSKPGSNVVKYPNQFLTHPQKD